MQPAFLKLWLADWRHWLILCCWTFHSGDHFKRQMVKRSSESLTRTNSLTDKLSHRH